MPRPDHTVNLGDFAREAGLTPEQVVDELAGGRLHFHVADDGTVFTDQFAVLDWIHRRMAAIGRFGIDKVGFPVFPIDWRALEEMPDTRPVRQEAETE